MKIIVFGIILKLEYSMHTPYILLLERLIILCYLIHCFYFIIVVSCQLSSHFRAMQHLHEFSVFGFLSPLWSLNILHQNKCKNLVKYHVEAPRNKPPQPKWYMKFTCSWLEIGIEEEQNKTSLLECCLKRYPCSGWSLILIPWTSTMYEQPQETWP